MPDLREMLSGERVHVMDGAMGTMLYVRGVFFNVCYDELNATHPDLVEGVHEQYIRAGAEIIETNTFGANPVKLSSHGLDRAHRGAQRAGRRAGGADRFGSRRRGGRGRAAGDPARTARPHLAGRGPRLLRAPGGRPAGGRRRRLRARDLFGPGRAGTGVSRGAEPLRPARDRARHRRRGRRDRVRDDARTGGPRGRGVGRRRRGPQLLGGARGHPGRTGADGRGHAAAALGRAQRRASPRHRRPQDLRHRARVHGPVRAPRHRRGREDRGRMLRHDPGTHPQHRRGGRVDPAAAHVGPGGPRGGRVVRAQAPSPAGLALRAGTPPRGRRIRDHGKGTTPPGVGHHADAGRLPRAGASGSRRDRHPRGPPHRPAERAGAGRPDRAVVSGRAAGALHLPRPHPLRA